MARVSYKTHEELRGPWLIPRSKLQRLDVTFDAVNELLKPSDESAKGKKFPPDRRQVELAFESGKKVVATSLAEAERIHPESEGGTVKSLEYILVRDGITTKVVAQEGKLNITIEPEWAPNAVDIFARVREWAADCQLPLRDRIFERYGGWLIFVGLIMMLASDPSTSGADYYRAQAREMLAKGISPSDTSKALEILLALAAQSPAPARTQAKVVLWVLISGIACVVLGLYSAFSPSLAIGVGSGQRKITAWTQTRRILIYVLPSLAFAAYILPKLSILLGASP